MQSSERPAYRLGPMTERDAAAICEWRYPAPYDIYNWPSWEQAVRESRDMADADIRDRQFRTVRRGDELFGFVQWFPLVAEDGTRIVRLGLGIRPDAVGSGQGEGFVTFLVRETAARHPGSLIDLEVAKPNVRARRAYERAGFRAVDEYERPFAGGGSEVVVNMVYLPTGRDKKNAE